jgi:hypothetical protein
MANNKIQIKRSVSNSTVTGLSNGELAFTANGNILYIGNPADGASVRIAGLQVPGTLTANQALVANATSGIDKVIVANAVITSIWANGAAGGAGDILFSNSTGIYWASSSQFGVNVNATFAWTNVHTFSANVNANTVNATAFTTSGVTTNTTGVFTTGTVNAATLSVGSSVVANTTRLVIGTGVGLQVNGTIGTVGQVLHSNGTTAYWAATTADITAVTAGAGLTGGGTTGDVTIDVAAGNGISVSTDAVAVLANSGLVANATGVHIVTSGDSTLIANSTGLYVNDATISIATSQLSGDVALGTQTSGNYVASVAAANGIAGAVAAAEGTAPSLYIVANNGIVANSTGIWAKQANGTSVDASGINVVAGVGQVVNSTGVHILANTGVVANTTGLFVNATYITSLAANLASPAVLGSTTANGALLTYANVSGQVNTATLYVTTSANIASVVQANSLGMFTTATVNAASFTAGATGTGTGGTVQNTTTMFLGNNTINTVITSAGLVVNGTATIANSSGVYTTGVVNSASHTSGAIGTGSGGTVQNATVMFVGNNTINAAINSTALSIGGNLIANSTGSNNAFNLGGTAAASYQLNSTLAANVATLTANNANNLGTVAAANYVQNTDSRVLSGNLAFSGANITFSGANLNVTGTNTLISSNVTVTGALITGTATDISFRNGTFSGNLAVLGTVVTVNTSQLVVNDNIIEFGAGNITTDIVDTGFFSPAGNSTAVWYSGIARIAASSTNTSPVFRVFASNTNPNTSGTIDATSNTRTGFLQSYLIPYGSGGALVANATNITIAANSTLAVSITANSLSLSTPLSGNNGGTGLSSIANNSLIFGNSTNGFNALALGTSGFVLQSNGTAVVYDTLDGGTF